MKRMEQLKNSATFKQMCDDFLSTTAIDPSLPGKFGVKRGLRNSDGSGVVAGITNVCCVHGYVISEGDKYHHAQGHYLEHGLTDADGLYNYKLVGGVPALRSDDEKAPERARVSAAIEISDLKEKLAETDYISAKIADGAATREEYADKLAERAAWRSRINELEVMI